MNTEVKEITEIPAALPISETEDEREKFLNETLSEDQTADDDPITEFDEDEDEFDEFDEQLPKPSKKKLFLAFVCFVFGFVLLVGFMSWFFGIGVFAKAKTQAVDRTAKDSSAATTPVSEEEKLKMALNLVADKEKGGQTDLVNPDADQTDSDDLDFNSSVDIPSTKATDVTEPMIIPELNSTKNPNRVDSSIPATNPEPNLEPNQRQNTYTSSERQNFASSLQSNPIVDEPKNTASTGSLGRSLFFGIERKEKADVKPASPVKTQGVVVVNNRTGNLTRNSKSPIPFGTLLPVRFLGAVYTLRSSGGLVRLELTRQVSGKNYSIPAGTVLVGSLRGNEYKRAFISVVGLIDPETGGLVKFGGEVMGTDGASGVVGRRRKVKSAWSRVLGGLRDAGAMALGAIGNRRSGGGTVIISDSTSKASGTITDELSGLVGNNKKANEFVEIPAGTNAFVQVTDLPDEISNTENFAQIEKSATGLSTSELADLFSEGSPEKIRAALPKMTPEFRQLAEKVLSLQR